MAWYRISTLCRTLVLALLPAAPGAALEAILDADFEWGDTGAWSTTFPQRCDWLWTFDRWLEPVRELHVAVAGSDAIGDGSLDSPFDSIERAADEATPGTAIRVHAGSYPGGTYLAGLEGTASAPIWIGSTRRRAVDRHHAAAEE